MSNSNQQPAVVLSKVTLSKERVDEYTVRHVFAGSKHLPKCYATGHNQWYTVYNYETGKYISSYGDLRGLKGVREWIANYDVNFEAQQAKEEAERIAEEQKWEEYCAAIDAHQEIYTTHTDEVPETFVVGTRIKAKFAMANKNSRIGEYAYNCSLNETRPEDRYWDRNVWVEPKNWAIAECEVDKVIVLTEEQYDYFCANLMDESFGAEIGLTRGGTGSDADLPEDWDYVTGSEAERDAWKAQAYEVVSVITAPNRTPFVAHGSGHQYARYVGLEPTNY